MAVTVKARNDVIYPILLGFGELCAVISVILVALLFEKNVSIATIGFYDWVKNPFSYHPLMMTIGLLFFYGNAILLYRTFRRVRKLTAKILHGTFLILSLGFAAFGLTAIIRSKEMGNRPHFMTFHSWIGLTTIILFVFQWILGFISFLFPQFSLEFRKSYMPSHRLWGKVIFLFAVVSILSGLSEHGQALTFFYANDALRPRRLIMNFFGVFTTIFCLIVIYLLSNDEYKRPTDENTDK